MHAVNKVILFFLFLFATYSVRSAAQVPYLERMVTLNVSDKPLSDVFKIISDETSVVFSYTQFDDRQKATFNYYKKPLRIVLDDLLKTSNCSYKTKDKYIIIKCSINTPKPIQGSFSEISGYVYNASDSSAINNVSIYIKRNMHCSLSNEYGYFIVSFPETSFGISLSIANKDYYDTTLMITNREQSKVVVYLRPRFLKKEIPVVALSATHAKDSIIPPVRDTVPAVKPNYLDKFRANFKTFNANFKNITDTLFTGISVSLVPSVSTNRFLSANTVNKYSFNIISGYSKGVERFEAGGIVNIDDGNVKYFQAAGIGNIVSGTLKGFQAGGIFNINHQATNGFQAAGIYNYGGKVHGLQAAGIYNASRGLHIGSQISGLANYADTIQGLQLSGFINTAKSVNGCQVAGFINSAKRVKGVQLSFMNFSDTCSGIPIGFFSFVIKGYHKFEFAGDELFLGTLSFRSGVEHFHNIFLAGINLKNSDMWTYGYGIGSGSKISKRWNVIFDLTAQQILSRNAPQVRLNLLNRFYPGIEYKILPKLRVSLGPTFNVMVADVYGPDYASTLSLLPSAFLYNRTGHDNTNVKMWIGGKLSLKIL